MNKTQKIVLAASLVLALGAGSTAVALAVKSEPVATPIAKESPSPTANETEETKPSPSPSETAEKDKDKEKVKGDAPAKPDDKPKAEDPAKPADPAKPEAPKAETEQPKPAKPAEPAPAPAPPAPPAPAPAPPAPAPAPPVTSSTAEESDVLARVNAKRAESGLGALALNGKLTQAALLQAEYQATNKTMTHDGNGGLGARVSSKGYNWCALAENVAMGYGSTEAVFNGWVNSSGHLANILSPNVTEMGLALAKDSNGTIYWAQVFGKGC